MGIWILITNSIKQESKNNELKRGNDLNKELIEMHGRGTRLWSCMNERAFLKPLLIPLSYIYGSSIFLWKWAYKRGILSTKRLPHPVISVGNITIGGTGKTPVVGVVADILVKRGYKPVILSRGYKRKGGNKSIIVTDGKNLLAQAEEVGDEPYMLAGWLHYVPILVGADRYSTGISATKTYDVDCFLLDDGFQHLRLSRDVDILVINARDPFGGKWLLPRGSLREPLSGLIRASLIIINKSGPGQDLTGIIMEVRKYNNHAPIVETLYLPDYLSASWDDNRKEIPLSSITGKSVLAFAGIASPEGFFDQLRELGARRVKGLAFDDHHWFSKGEIDNIKEYAKSSMIDLIITTEKDAVRLPKNLEGILVLKMRMEIKGDKGAFENTILSALPPKTFPDRI